jgi:hypothetical protein
MFHLNGHQVCWNHRFLAAVELGEARRAQLEGAAAHCLPRFRAQCSVQVYMRRVDPDGVSAMVSALHELVATYAASASAASASAASASAAHSLQDTESYKKRFRYMVENLFKDN